MAASVDEKIIALEEKALFKEDAIQKLDDVIARQYKVIDALSRRIKELEVKTESLQDEMEKQPVAVINEKPPHY